VHFVDDQVQQVLDALQQKGLLKNTIVILTADHGEEINDNHSGYWEHASAYDAYQLHVPMLVYWPGKQPKVYNYFTSHYDLAPTLMSQVLGCQNPAADYSIGNSLFNSGNRSVLVAGSYADYAIVTHDRATRVYPGGDYVIDDPRGRHLDQATLKKTPLEQAFELLNKYFKP
jgi:membrane-anchored protein YejM (alkaline phosphatase superfamily)